MGHIRDYEIVIINGYISFIPHSNKNHPTPEYLVEHTLQLSEYYISLAYIGASDTTLEKLQYSTILSVRAWQLCGIFPLLKLSHCVEESRDS